MLAFSITAVFKAAKVFILHASKEASYHSYKTYGKGNTLCGQLGLEGSYSGHRVVYCDVSNAA